MSQTFTDIIPADSLFGKLRAQAPDAWQSYVCHDFIKQLGNGTLSETSFKHYLIQDYLFLIQFARAYALAVYKAEDLSAMRQFSGTVHAILDMEMSLHLEFCKGWGRCGGPSGCSDALYGGLCRNRKPLDGKF